MKLLVLPFLMLAGAASADHVLDLAGSIESETISGVSDSKYYVEIINMAPGRSYTVVTDVVQTVPKFDDPRITSGEQPPEEQIGLLATTEQETIKTYIKNTCHKFYVLVTAFKAITDEKAVAEAVSNLEDKMAEAEAKGCPGAVSLMKGAIDRTKKKVSLRITENSKGTLTVTADSFKREVIVSGKKVEWMLHVGLGFTDNRDEAFFSEQYDDQGVKKYRIAKGTNREDLDYSALALFTYPLYRFQSVPSLQFGLTGGLGVDLNAPVVYAGPTLVIAENLLISAGGLIQKFDVLNNPYRVGQDLGENAIDSTALTYKTYKTTYGLVIGYRFK